MGALLRISGAKLNADALKIGWSLKPLAVHRKGDASILKNRKNSQTQLVYEVSAKGFSNLKGQIKDAIGFLKKNKKYLTRISGNKSIDYIALDFCFNSRISVRNVEVQYDYYPSELIRLAGNLNLHIWITQWGS